LQEKLLFIITDAGANDLTDEAFSRTVERAMDLNLRVYLIYPSGSGVKVGNVNMDDSPEEAYDDLVSLISSYMDSRPEGGDIIFREFEFNSEDLLSEEGRQEDFAEQHKELLDSIQVYMDHIFTAGGSGEIPRDVVLYFSDERLLTEMRNWSDRRIQVLNHVVKYVKSVDDPTYWEERIAIPARPIESFLREIRAQDDVSLSDLKKLVIINSLVSVDDIETARRLYDHIKPLIELKTAKSADDVFYKALIRREPDEDTSWNEALGEEGGPLGEYLSEREFHLNSFNPAIQRKFMYIKVNDLYVQDKLEDIHDDSLDETGRPQRESAILHPFSLHIGSYRTIERAERAIAQYGEENISAYWVKVDLKEKGVWYRIFTGYFQDRQEAERFREEHELEDGIIKNTRYANLIGSYQSSEELEEKILLITSLDYSPFVITDPNGTYRLYVGSFYDRDMAEKQYNDLISDNIQNQVVER